MLDNFSITEEHPLAKVGSIGAREIAKQLRALATLTEELGLSPSPYMAAPEHPNSCSR